MYGLSLPDAVHTPRIHHQWMPNKLWVESHTLSPEVLRTLQSYGYPVSETPSIAFQHAVERWPSVNCVWGVADLRAEGGVAVE
jgi:gamma-glutamyltranspeptidase